MSVLIGIALKSLLIAGLTLGLLKLMSNRSAAERSWIAHIGLLALVIMAVAPLVLPAWNVEAPALLGASLDAAPAAQPAATHAAAPDASVSAIATVPAVARPGPATLSPAAAATALYALPAAALLFMTVLALARLVTLQARADVLVDSHWLSALARAQRRMGFKHGTALLTSDDLASPISWGLIRPVILLNSRAVEAAGEAEAIIAHELAHVARMDWIKLLLARVASALFWFNPWVWLLAREAHQLREEAADDSVLAADIVDTDYAQLLVGVARHECPGLLLGAHGVAPSKGSLARRVARVLDGKSVRGPVARSFALGVFAGAVLVAAPLAALTITPAAPKAAKAAGGKLAASEPASAYYPQTRETPTDLPSIIATGVSSSVTAAVSAATSVAGRDSEPDFRAVGPSGASVESARGTMVARGPDGATVTVYPPDAQGRRKTVARAANGATVVSYADADGDPIRRHNDSVIDRVIEMKAVGVTPEYLAAVRGASPALANADLDDIVGMRAVGVTPEYIRQLAAAGLGTLNVDQLTEARAVGVDADYVRAMSAAGLRATLDEYVEMRAVGVTPEYAAQFRKSGYNVLGPRQLIRMHEHGVTADALRSAPPRPPRAPRPPEVDDNDPDGG
jgi:bla regulator protein BlaR1